MIVLSKVHKMNPRIVVVAATLLIAVHFCSGKVAKDPLEPYFKCIKGFKGVPDHAKKVIEECRTKHGKADHCYNFCLRESLGYFKKNARGEVTGVNVDKIKKISEEMFTDWRSQEKKTYDFTSCFRSFRKPHLFKITGKCKQLKSFDTCYMNKLKKACKLFKG